MSNYYKKIEKKDYYYKNAPVALKRSYDTTKAQKGVIVQGSGKNEFLLVPTNLVDEFVVTCLSRQDVRKEGFDADKLTDDEMAEIASNLGDSFVGDGGYWDLIDYECSQLGLEQNLEEDDDQ